MNRIRERRRELDITIKQLAETVGVSVGAISHYETGRRAPDPDMLSRIANALGVSVDYILGRDDAMPSQKQENPPADMRAEAKQLLESMTDEQYQAALQYLKFLQSQK